MPKKLILYLYKFRRSVKDAFPVILFFAFFCFDIWNLRLSVRDAGFRDHGFF